LSLGVGGYFLTEGEIGLCLCLFYFLDAGGSVRGRMCVYTHTRTHTAHGVHDVSPGVGTRHLEGPKNPDDLNLAYMYLNMCTKYTFVYECWVAG